jgi:UDP-N-acetylmuramate--alanine ligase
MSALARYFNNKGVKVTGYDKTVTTLTKKLGEEGIEIYFRDEIDLIPDNIDIVVYTPAIPKDHKQLTKLRKGHTKVLKRSEMLGLISDANDAIAVAGTHGKTSTTAMLSHIMRSCGIDISAFIGGILTDYNTNYFAGESPWVVLEADEYDRSFLHLHPEITILQSMDADHLDIYGSHDEMIETFVEFLNKTAYGGKLIINSELKPLISEDDWKGLKSIYTIITFGFDSAADAVISDISVSNGMSEFILSYKGEEAIVSQFLPGDHNRMNATAAILASILAGCDMEEAISSLTVFKGIKRRYEVIARRDVTYVDDYAHHPKELEYVIGATKELFLNKKVLGIFQPHLYSRTKDFQSGFAKALSKLDEVILMDIYPAREKPIKGVSSHSILDKITNQNKSLLNVEEIIEKVKNKDYDVVLTLGAGDIDLLVPKIKDIILNNG